MRKPFSLQAVLDYKTSILEVRELELAELLRQQIAATQKMASLQELESREQVEMKRIQQAKYLDVVDMRWRQERQESLREQIAAQQEHLSRVQDKVEAKREEVLVAHQEQEVLVKLQEKEALAEREEDQRRELSEADEISTTRHFRRQIANSIG